MLRMMIETLCLFFHSPSRLIHLFSEDLRSLHGILTDEEITAIDDCRSLLASTLTEAWLDIDIISISVESPIAFETFLDKY